MPRRRWFTWAGEQGDRTLVEQLAGLEHLRSAMPGAAVLDLGCAEGLLAREFVAWGASRVDGVEIVREAVKDARELLKYEIRDGVASIHHGSILALDELDLLEQYDIVCALAVVQKVERCDLALEGIARRARDLLVLRNPPEHGAIISTERQRGRRYDTRDILAPTHFLADEVRGSRGEWIGYFLANAYLKRMHPWTDR